MSDTTIKNLLTLSIVHIARCFSHTLEGIIMVLLEIIFKFMEEFVLSMPLMI